MDKDEESQNAAQLAKVMALMCVRNTGLENIHAGKYPVSEIGDYSDVFVRDAQGRQIPWTEVSHFHDGEMKALMKEVVNRLFTFLVLLDDPEFQAWIQRWAMVSRKWDEPDLDPAFLSVLGRDDKA